MFIVSLTYKAPIENIEEQLENHVNFLKEHYALGNFHASGRKVPRTGGIIMSQIKDRNKLENIVQQDPFYLNNLIDYEIIEFIPTMTSEGLKCLLENQ